MIARRSAKQERVQANMF